MKPTLTKAKIDDDLCLTRQNTTNKFIGWNTSKSFPSFMTNKIQISDRLKEKPEPSTPAARGVGRSAVLFAIMFPGLGGTGESHPQSKHKKTEYLFECLSVRNVESMLKGNLAVPTTCGDAIL